MEFGCIEVLGVSVKNNLVHASDAHGLDQVRSN